MNSPQELSKRLSEMIIAECIGDTSKVAGLNIVNINGNYIEINFDSAILKELLLFPFESSSDKVISEFEKIYRKLENGFKDPIIYLLKTLNNKNKEEEKIPYELIDNSSLLIGKDYIKIIYNTKKFIEILTETLREIKEKRNFDSSLGYISTKLQEHLKRSLRLNGKIIYVKELYIKASQINPFIPIYVFLMHRITHNNTSGKNGGKLDDKTSRELFKKLYISFLEMLHFFKINLKQDFPEDIDKAYELFQNKEPEFIFIEHFGV